MNDFGRSIPHVRRSLFLFAAFKNSEGSQRSVNWNACVANTAGHSTDHVLKQVTGAEHLHLRRDSSVKKEVEEIKTVLNSRDNDIFLRASSNDNFI